MVFLEMPPAWAQATAAGLAMATCHDEDFTSAPAEVLNHTPSTQTQARAA